MREHERRGAQASADMQRAARAVARENARLRALLALRGVGRCEVEAFLARPEEEGKHQDDDDAAPGSRPEGTDVGTAATGNPGSWHTYTPDGASAPQSDVGAATYRLGSEPSEMCPPDRAGAGVGEGNRPSHVEMQVTHCSAAASMIAELQGHGDATQARELLGCGSSRNCHVKNTRLFQLMVEST